MWGMRGWGKRDLLLGGAHSELWHWVGRFWSEVRRWVCSGVSASGRSGYVVWGMFGPFSDVDSSFYFRLCLDLIMESSCFCLIQ